MFQQKQGIPAESEIVLCTVSKVQYHSVFVNLDEYEGKTGMLHISEVSPGRIRNINDFVKEGKVIVCKVLSVDPKRGHIDVSLRRVTETQRREKMDQVKQELRAEKIIEFVAKETKQDGKELYNKIIKFLGEEYRFIYELFYDVAVGEFDPKTLKLDAKTTQCLVEVIKQRIKPPEVEIKSHLHIECYASNGVEIVKKVLTDISGLMETTEVFYLGGGSYSVRFFAETYEEVEKPFGEMKKILESQKKDFVYKLQRVDGKQ